MSPLQIETFSSTERLRGDRRCVDIETRLGRDRYSGIPVPRKIDRPLLPFVSGHHGTTCKQSSTVKAVWQDRQQSESVDRAVIFSVLRSHGQRLLKKPKTIVNRRLNDTQMFHVLIDFQAYSACRIGQRAVQPLGGRSSEILITCSDQPGR